MAEHPVRVTPTGYAVLGLLSFGRELSGYDLKKWADASLRFFYWSPAVSQIYGELKKLSAAGLVAEREVPIDDLRNKRLYTITEAGRTALHEWMTTSADQPVLKHPVMLRVWLGHLAEPGRLRELLVEHQTTVEALRDDAQEAAEAADPEFTHPKLVNRWAARYYQAELDLAQAMLDDLAELDEPRSGHRACGDHPDGQT